MKQKHMETEAGEKTKHRLPDIAKNVRKFVADISDKSEEVVKEALDRNNNGKIDLDDFGLGKDSMAEAKEKAQKIGKETRKNTKVIVEKAIDNVKEGAIRLDQAVAESKLDYERKTLRPVFSEDLLPFVSRNRAYQIQDGGSIYYLIRIVERDKRREQSIVCKNSIGYWTKVKKIEILNLYEDVVKNTDLIFHPLPTRSVFYIDPFQSNVYVNLDEYFNYLKKARVNELEMVANELGAKKVTITFKEWKSHSLAKHKSSKIKVNGSKGISADADYHERGLVDMNIATNLTFTGHDTPRVPLLTYFKGEKDIEQLIKLRTDPEKKNQLVSKTYSLEYNESKAIKYSLATEIDKVMQILKIGISISHEVQRENKTILEYYVEF